MNLDGYGILTNTILVKRLTLHSHRHPPRYRHCTCSCNAAVIALWLHFVHLHVDDVGGQLKLLVPFGLPSPAQLLPTEQ